MPKTDSLYTGPVSVNLKLTRASYLMKVSSYQHVLGLTGLAGRASVWISWKSLRAFVNTNEEYSQKSGRLPVAKSSLERQNTLIRLYTSQR